MYPKRHLTITGKLSLSQRLIRWMYLKYVYKREQEALMAMFPTVRVDKIEMAMMEKEYYEISGELH